MLVEGPLEKQSGKALRPFERLDAFFTSLKEAVVCVDEHQHILALNSAAEVMMGYVADEVVGQSFKILLPVADHASFDEICSQSGGLIEVDHTDQSAGAQRPLRRTTAAPYGTRLRLVECQRKNGSRFFVETTISSVFIAEPMLTVVLRDVTEQRLAARTNALLATVATSVAEAVVSISEDGTIATWNRAAERVLGYMQAEVIGRDAALLEVFDEAGVPLSWRDRHTKLPREIAGLMKRQDGSVINVAICVSAIQSEEIEFAGICAVIRDCSEEIRRKQQDEFLLREICHRAKNNLAIVSALVRETAGRSDSISEYETKLASRIASIGYAHDALIRMNWRGAELHSLVQAQLHPFCDPEAGQCDLVGPTVILAAEAVQTLGLAVHELAANARRFGAFSNPKGRVKFSWELCTPDHGAQSLALSWVEFGGPTVEVPDKFGFGRTFLEKLTNEYLDADAELTFENSGLRWQAFIRPQFLSNDAFY